MLESFLPLAMATQKMCPSLTSTTQKQHVFQTGLILHWNVLGMEGERFILHQLYKNTKFLGVITQAAVGDIGRTALQGSQLCLESHHRNQRKKREVLEVANLGHSLLLDWCLCSGGGHMWGGKTCLALCNHGINLAPHTRWGHGQCCSCSHVSMEQVALAGKLLRDAKDSAGSDVPH